MNKDARHLVSTYEVDLDESLSDELFQFKEFVKEFDIRFKFSGLNTFDLANEPVFFPLRTMSQHLVLPQSLEFRPSVPFRTVKYTLPGNSDNGIFFTQLPKVNLSLSLDHREHARGRWDSLPKMYQSQSYQYTRDNICYLVDSKTSYYKNRLHYCSKVSQPPHRQLKPYIYTPNRFLDCIPKFENNRKLLIDNSVYLKRIEPTRPDILPPTQKQSELKMIPIPAPTKFKKPIHYIFPTPNVIPSIVPRTNKYISELHGFFPSIPSMAAIVNGSKYTAYSFPMLCHPIPYIRKIHPQGYNTCLSRLVIGVNKAKYYNSLPNNGQVSNLTRKHRVDITSNKLYVIGISTLRALRYQNVFYSSMVCISPSKQVICSQHLDIPLKNSNNRSTDFTTSSEEYKHFLFPKVNREPIISPILKSLDISSSQDCNSYLLEAFTTKLPHEVLVEASPSTKYLSTLSIPNDSSTDVQLMQSIRTQNNISRSSILPFTLSDSINSNQPMQSATILTSDPSPSTHPKDHIANKTLTTTSTTDPKNSNVSLLSNDLLLYTTNIPSTSILSNSSPTKLSSGNVNLTKKSSHSTLYTSTSLIPSHQNIPFNDSQFEPNLYLNQYKEKENLINNEMSNKIEVLNTFSCSNDEKQLQFKELPEESRISLNQSTERFIYSPHDSLSLSYEQFVNECENEYLTIQRKNTNIQLDEYLQAFHSQSDNDISSNMFVLQGESKESESDQPTTNNDKDILIENNLVNSVLSKMIRVDSPVVTAFINEIVDNILYRLDFNNLINNEQFMELDINNNSSNTLPYDQPSSTSSYNRKSMTSYAHHSSFRYSSSSTRCGKILRDQLKVNQIMRRSMENQTNVHMRCMRLRDAFTNLFDITHAYTYSYYQTHKNFESTSSDEDVK